MNSDCSDEIKDSLDRNATTIECELPMGDDFNEFVDNLTEFIKKKRGDARDFPMHCPYDNTRGCRDGNVCLLKHTENDTHMTTSVVVLKGQYCRAWSDKYGRCLRIEPVTNAERMKANHDMKVAMSKKSDPPAYDPYKEFNCGDE